MNPLQKFIFKECANFNFGKCIGKECDAEKKRCAYFERCLIGLSQYKQNPNYPMFEKGIISYALLHKKNGAVR